MTTIFIFILIQLCIGLAYYAYTQHKAARDLSNFKPSSIIIGTPTVFTADDENKLASDKEGLRLVIKKLDTRLSIMYDGIRIPSDDTAFRQGKINMVIDIRNDLISLYNRTSE